MKHKIFILLGVFFVFSTIVFTKDVNKSKDKPVFIQTEGNRPQIFNFSDTQNSPNSREEFDLITDDLEGDTSGWETEGGWQLTDTEFNSESHSFWSPDQVYTDSDGVPVYRGWNLTSPSYELPLIGAGESMHFSFFVNVDMPDNTQEDDPATEEDESGYLADYYSVSIMDTEDIAWSIDDFNPSSQTGGNNYRCAKDDVGTNGGYLNDWVQFMDTETFTVPDNGSLTADMFWAIESPAGAAAENIACTGGPLTYIDGWDQGNVQISVDGGETFTIITGSIPYDFDCGYGMVNNGIDGGAGWGGFSADIVGGSTTGWNNISFDLSQWAGQDAVVRFAFYSDPGWDTNNDVTATGFQVDNVLVGSAFSDDADGETSSMNSSGSVWVDQTYDYYEACVNLNDGSDIIATSAQDCIDQGGDYRPGSWGWEEYGPNSPFSEYSNIYMDISNFAGKTVKFRFQTRHDEDTNGGQGEGLFIDDLRVYKISGGSHPTPTGLTANPGDGEVTLSWDDMNFSGQVAYQYDNDSFDEGNGIFLSSEDPEAFAWVGNTFNVPGSSTVETVSIYNINAITCDVATYGGLPVDVEIAAFGTFGTIFSTNLAYSQSVQLTECGWNTFTVDWEMNGPFIIAHTFSGSVTAALDATVTPSQHSMSLLGTTWDVWYDDALANNLPDGEWGIRATVDQEGAGVTYNVFRDGGQIVGNLGTNSYIDTFVDNNTTYLYQVSASYPDGEDSEVTNIVEATPLSQTVHEVYLDDGSYESEFDFTSTGELLAVKFNALSSGEELTRFKWYQISSGGAFYIKLWADDNGSPGEELFSKVVAGGNTGLDGWNELDLAGEFTDDNGNPELLSGNFWAGIRSFSSTKNFGIDESSAGSTAYAATSASNTSSADWAESFPGSGNAMIRLFLDDLGGGTSCISGDVNNNGSVEVSDIVLMVNFIMGVMSPDDQQFCAADLNEDGSIAVNDIVLVINIILGS